jgi:sigma-B regulation protein RsbU (phosphoserine phosphatase)
MIEQPRYEEQSIRLSPGDRIFLYTDGVVEAEDAEEKQFGTDGLAAETLNDREKNLDDCVESIMDTVRTWVGSRGLRDDVSILAFELNDLK